MLKFVHKFKNVAEQYVACDTLRKQRNPHVLAACAWTHLQTHPCGGGYLVTHGPEAAAAGEGAQAFTFNHRQCLTL